MWPVVADCMDAVNAGDDDIAITVIPRPTVLLSQPVELKALLLFNLVSTSW